MAVIWDLSLDGVSIGLRADDVYHVLLVAEKRDRVKFMEKNYSLSPEQAVQVVEKRERRRVNLYRKSGKEDYDQHYLYHLVLNMSVLSLEKASKLICKLTAV